MSVQPIDSFTDENGDSWLRLSNGHKVALATGGGGGHHHDPRYVNVDGDTMVGNLHVAVPRGDSAVRIGGDAGTNRVISFHTGGSAVSPPTNHRFVLGINSDPETGDNAGSNFFLNRYPDAGQAGTGTLVFGVSRATGVVRFREIPASDAADDSWRVASMTNGWVPNANYPVAYRKLVSGLVVVRGTAGSGTVGSGVAAFTLPPSYRPSIIQEFATPCSGTATARITVQNSGAVCITALQSPGTNAWVSFSFSLFPDA